MKLTVERDIFMPGHFGLWDWSDEDFEKPMKFPNEEGEAYIKLKTLGYTAEKKRQSAFSAVFGVTFSSPSRSTLQAVKSSGANSSKLAEKYFNLFDSAMRRMEAALRSTAGLKELYFHHHETLDSFFTDRSYRATWTYGDETGDFTPKIKVGRRRLASSFQRKNLIDTEKWDKLQDAILQNDLPSDTQLELLRIRSRIIYRDRALPLIEAAIITERTIREFVVSTLHNQGMSRKRIKELKNDLTFSLNSNVFIPLCLSKTEALRLEKHIDGVNKLRKIRNDVAHGNIGYNEVSFDDAKEAIESSMALVKAIEAKLHES
jgi:hypothetical protein